MSIANLIEEAASMNETTKELRAQLVDISSRTVIPLMPHTQPVFVEHKHAAQKLLDSKDIPRNVSAANGKQTAVSELSHFYVADCKAHFQEQCRNFQLLNAYKKELACYLYQNPAIDPRMTSVSTHFGSSDSVCFRCSKYFVALIAEMLAQLTQYQLENGAGAESHGSDEKTAFDFVQLLCDPSVELLPEVLHTAIHHFDLDTRLVALKLLVSLARANIRACEWYAQFYFVLSCLFI